MGRVFANAEAGADTQICMSVMSIGIKHPPDDVLSASRRVVRKQQGRRCHR
jgi:hypothetical protein